MEILPRTMGTRPRLACEIRAEGVVAARADDASAVLTAVARVALAEGVVPSHLHVTGVGMAGADVLEDAAADGIVGEPVLDVAGRRQLVEAVRKALDAVCEKTRNVTLVVPDGTVRVLLLEFDELPAKAAEALPVVRFRLKKLLPFDADDAAVSYQVMSSGRSGLQVLAVAMPKQVLADYESVVRDAGFEPGAVLPSTLAALAGLGGAEMPMLVVNAGREGVTTAIVKGGVLLLHRTVDLEQDWGGVTRGEGAADAGQEIALGVPANEVAQAVSVAAAYFEDTLEMEPSVVLSAGPMGAEGLSAVLDEAGVGSGMRAVAVREMVERQMLGAGAETAGRTGGVPLGWLAGVRGALAN